MVTKNTTEVTPLDLDSITPDDIPTQRPAPEGNYLLTVVDYKKSEEGTGYYLVNFRVSEALDGQDMNGAKSFVDMRFSFNTIGGRQLWQLLKAVNNAWADADPKPAFRDMLEEAVGTQVIAEVVHNYKEGRELPYVNLKNFRAAS